MSYTGNIATQMLHKWMQAYLIQKIRKQDLEEGKEGLLLNSLLISVWII